MKQVSIRVSMLRNMLMLVGLFSLAVLATTVLGAQQIAQRVAQGLISQTITLAESRVQGFIQPFQRNLQMVGQWVQKGAVTSLDAKSAATLLTPLLDQYPQLSSVVLADDLGRSLQVGRQGEGYGQWIYDNESAPGSLRRRAWQDSYDQFEEFIESETYDARTRPWFYRGNSGQIQWTDPYAFFSTNSPGMTISLRTQAPSGDGHVVALDILLDEIDRFTQQLRPGRDGMILMTDGQGQIIGLPDHPRFADPQQRNDAFLKHPGELNWQLAADATRAFQPGADGRVQTVPIHFDSEGTRWWGQGKWISIGGNARLWVGALIPESRLLQSVHRLRIWIVTATVLVTILAILQAMHMSNRYGDPIRTLAQESFRISRGDLDSEVSVQSQLVEVNSLAQAHNKMRLGLKVLLKLEDDLLAARQIQQSTLPEVIAQPAGFDIAARGRPAEATGGDTYDAIGLKQSAAKNAPQVVTEQPDEVILVLADASGHGVGPALAVTQVRAMVRMAARTANRLGTMVGQLNHQLHGDLRAGRFITCWIGHIDAQQRELEYFSAGQAPILHYQASSRQCVRLGANSPPFGIVESLGEIEIQRLQLPRGDIVVVASDGVFDARDPEGELYGVSRVEKLVATHADATAQALIDALFIDLAEHSAFHKNVDDQTALIVKSV